MPDGKERKGTGDGQQKAGFRSQMPLSATEIGVRRPFRRTTDTAGSSREAATPEMVSDLRRQAELVVNSHGTEWEFATHVRSHKVLDIPKNVVPASAHRFFRFDGGPIDCEVITDSRIGKTSVEFRQISFPDNIPDHVPGYFKDRVVYDLSGDGSRTAEATFMNTNMLLEVPNIDHPGDQADNLTKPEVQQLAQTLTTLDSPPQN